MTEPVPFPAGVVVREGELLARHVPHRVGGPCDAYVVVHDRDAVVPTLAACRDRGWSRTWLGAGTRVVPRDGGLAGAVLRLGEGFVGVEDDGDGWWVGAATPAAWLADVAGGPLAELSTWPGTLGASWALDPHWGRYVDRVRVVRRGHEVELAWSDLKARDRVVWLQARVRKDVKGKPPSLVAPGGWFTPVDGDEVTALLRDAGLAGTRLRAVALPSSEPDRIVNLGGGTAQDVTALLRGVVERVHQSRGVKLSDRMIWWGRVS